MPPVLSPLRCVPQRRRRSPGEARCVRPIPDRSQFRLSWPCEILVARDLKPRRCRPRYRPGPTPHADSGRSVGTEMSMVEPVVIRLSLRVGPVTAPDGIELVLDQGSGRRWVVTPVTLQPAIHPPLNVARGTAVVDEPLHSMPDP